MREYTFEDFEVDMLLTDNQIIDRHGIKLKILSLKGHTFRSIGIMYNDYLFVGDALVNRKLIKSIDNIIKK